MFNLAHCLHNLVISVCVCVCQYGYLCSRLRKWWQVEELVNIRDLCVCVCVCEKTSVTVCERICVLCVRACICALNQQLREVKPREWRWTTMALVFTQVTMETTAHPARLTFPGDNNTADWCVGVCVVFPHVKLPVCLWTYVSFSTCVCVYLYVSVI